MMHNKEKTLKLTKKLIIAYIIILVIPIIFMSNSLFRRYEEENKNTVIRQLEKEMKLIEDDINAKITLMKKIAFSISINSGLVDRIGADKIFSYEEVFIVDQIYAKNLEVILNSNQQIFTVRIFNDNPNMYEYWPVIFDMNRIKDYDLLNEILTKDEVWSTYVKSNYIEMYEKAENNSEIISYMKNIKKTHHDYNSFVEIGMLKDKFLEAITHSNMLEDGFYYIIQGDSIIDRSPNSYEVVGKKRITDFEEWLVSQNEQEAQLNEYEDIVTTRLYIPELDLYLYKGISLSGINSLLQKETTNIVLTALSLIFVLTVVTYLITYVMFKRLRRVIYSVENISKNQPDQFPIISGNDEISHLSFKIKDMLKEIDKLNKEAIYEQKLALNAELKALQTQINTHFIYNTLETFKMMAEIDENYELSDLITNFGDLLRYSMQWNEKRTVKLYQELEYIKKYISLLNIRFDYEINLNINVSEDLKKVEIPKMSIQPIVENSFIHGIEDKCEDSNITIDMDEDNSGNTIIITITDDGCGIEKNKLTSINKQLTGIDVSNDDSAKMGIGIKNINDRIKLFYGHQYGIRFESIENQFTKAIITLPKEGW